MKNLFFVTAVSVGLIASTAAMAGKGHSHGHDHKHDHKKEAGHTQLDAHEHGSGKLNIAVAGKTMTIELEIPAADIVGFEHAAKTKKQKADVKAATAKLKDALKLFVVNSDAACKLASAKVETEGAMAEGGHDHGHSHGHSHGKKEAKSEESHSEFHVNYKLTCGSPKNMTAIEFAFFDAFPNSQELEVSLVGDRGVKKFEATRNAKTFSFPASS